MVEIGDKWTCPRCNEVVWITENGIYHTSNINGPHFIKYLIADLNAFKALERKQLNEIFYGRSEQ